MIGYAGVGINSWGGLLTAHEYHWIRNTDSRKQELVGKCVEPYSPLIPNIVEWPWIDTEVSVPSQTPISKAELQLKDEWALNPQMASKNPSLTYQLRLWYLFPILTVFYIIQFSPWVILTKIKLITKKEI